MLVTPNFKFINDPIHEALISIIGRGRKPYVYRKGLIVLTHWNPEFDIDPACFYKDYNRKLDFNPKSIIGCKRMVQRARDQGITKDNEWVLKMDTDASPLKIFRNYKRPLRKVPSDFDDKSIAMFIDSYGVCDSPEQILEVYDFEKDERKLFICFVEIRREEQDPSGGWRYHKWGSYIGTQNPQHEYIYDDKHIERVYTYNIYEMK